MNSKQRMRAVWNGQPTDYLPLTTWCFGFPAPVGLAWERNGHPVAHWFTKRLEHIHQLPAPWELADDFQRVLAFRSLRKGAAGELRALGLASHIELIVHRPIGYVVLTKEGP